MDNSGRIDTRMLLMKKGVIVTYKKKEKGAAQYGSYTLGTPKINQMRVFNYLVYLIN